MNVRVGVVGAFAGTARSATPTDYTACTTSTWTNGMAGVARRPDSPPRAIALWRSRSCMRSWYPWITAGSARTRSRVVLRQAHSHRGLVGDPSIDGRL